MSLLDPLFGSKAVADIFSDFNTVQRMLDFEAALARAESRVGTIPPSAVDPIVSSCRAELFKLSAIAEAGVAGGNLAIPLVKQLTARVASADKTAARYVHWGATSQDVIDTALVLQICEALSLIEADLVHLCSILAHLADEHRRTPMVGRTWLQQAVPTVLGLKFAGWLDAFRRHHARLSEAHARASVIQFGGAAGTLASLGDQGLNIAAALASELKLRLPELPWHAHRDRIAEVATALALCTGSLGKMARDIGLLSQTEVAEISEPVSEGRGASSTMPQKRNPVASAVALAAAIRMPGLAATMLSAVVQEHERGLGGWHAEWETLPEMFRLTAGALQHMREAATGLQIDTNRMARNLNESRGLVFAEAVTIALAKHIGRGEAQGLIEAACRRAISQAEHLRDVLLQDATITKHLAAEEIEQLFHPLSYIGVSDAFITRAIAAHKVHFGDLDGK